MSKSRKKKKFLTREEQNLEDALLAKTINQEEESKMAEQTTNQTPATEAKATAALAQAQTAPAAQQPAAAPAETQAPAQTAPTVAQSAKPQPAPAQAAQPQPQALAAPAASAQAPAPTQTVQQAPAHWSEKCSDPQVVAAMAVAQAFINAHPDQAESVGLLILNSTSPAEFQMLLNQKEKSTMNSNTTTASTPAVTPAPAAVAPAVLPAIPVVAGEDRKSFSGWTTTEMVVVGIGAAALIGVSIWAVCATIRANKYKAALADAVAGNPGM